MRQKNKVQEVFCHAATFVGLMRYRPMAYTAPMRHYGDFRYAFGEPPECRVAPRFVCSLTYVETGKNVP
jgi:hypothetical protein